MDAIVLAGGAANPRDPLYPYSLDGPKALVPIAGKPMVQWVLDALGGAARVDRVFVVGFGSDPGLTCAKETRWVPDAGSLMGNAAAGAAAALSGDPAAADRALLVVSSDIPAIDAAMLDWVIGRAEESADDLYYCAIERAVMEERFPGSGRSYLRLSDAEVCGGDLAIARGHVFSERNGAWLRLADARKSAVRMAWVLGFDILLDFLLGRLGIADLAARAGRRLGLKGRAILCPWPELGMDVDKPFQFDMVERHLQDRSAAAG